MISLVCDIIHCVIFRSSGQKGEGNGAM